MLTEKQYQAIALMATKTLSNKQIADKIGVKDRTIYNWKRDKEFMAELNRREQAKKEEIYEKTNNELTGYADMALQQIAYLSQNGSTEKIQLEASKFLYEAQYGKATAKTADVTEKKDNKEEEFDLDKIMDSFDKEDNEKVIHLNQAN